MQKRLFAKKVTKMGARGSIWEAFGITLGTLGTKSHPGGRLFRGWNFDEHFGAPGTMSSALGQPYVSPRSAPSSPCPASQVPAPPLQS